MGRSAALIAAAFMLAACGDLDLSKMTTNPTDLMSGAIRLDLESEPAGAEARSSVGSSCRTPCSLWIKQGIDITVTFTLDGYEPQTIAVAQTYVHDTRGDWREGAVPAHADLDPNPARVVLVTVPPPPPPEPPKPPPVKKKPHVAAKPAAKEQASSGSFAPASSASFTPPPR
ncbi:MAG: hypothetical protein ACLPKB_21675 [Xanthobacteraceae bacterium]